MVAGSERCHQSIALVDVKPVELDLRAPDVILNEPIGSSILEFVPTLRSGSFFDIGTRKDMEDEHIRIDDLASSLDSPFQWPAPTAFYGVFDGHGGPDAASYIQKHALRFFFQDACFPQALEFNPAFLTEVENSMRRSFLQVDLAIADDRTISSSCGTTALTALVLGRHLLVANVGDCRAVLCRQGKAVELSEDHRALHAGERKRIEICGGYIDDGYLNGVLSVTRALGDWDIKSPTGGLPSPLISEPEFKQVKLTEHDEFMIIGCDGIWDVMTSQHAVGVVRRGLRRHDDPERCARDLVLEALRLKTADNLTVIVVCFSKEHREEERPRLRYCSLSSEALCNLRKSLECDADNDDQS